MYELRDVCIERSGRLIMDGVSTALRPGRFTVVLGPNGAGKSTLLKVATGELVPDRGHALFEGMPIRAIPPRVLAARRAVLPQSARLAFPFTVFEVVRLGLDCRAGISPAMRAQAPLAALERVDLPGFGARRYEALSGGEQQRVHLARVLCQVGEPVVDGVPRYLFLDEPTSSLDIKHQIGTLEIARRFARSGGGVLAILHDLNLAAAFADHLIVMRRGRLVAEGPPHEILTDALVEDVFELPLRVRATPTGDAPFVLPQSAMN
jgi:iron complex transport system ATP-binding protein